MPGGNFICYRCKHPFRDHKDLQRHYDRKKKCVPIGTVIERPEWYCETCKTAFSNKSNYTAHLKTQIHERLTACGGRPSDSTVPTNVHEIARHSDNPLISSANNAPNDEETIVEHASLRLPNNEAFEAAGPSSSSDKHDDQAVDFMLPTIDTSKIRKTDENPPRVAVFDLITVITGQRDAARMIHKRLIASHVEVRAICYDYKFKGRGQQFTPVTTAKGAVIIINALPGKVATKLRVQWADVIVRYLGGDLTLAREIAHNKTVQDNTPDDHPLRFFGQDVESRALPDSVTGVQDMRQPQVYLGYAGPPEDWTDIKRSDGTQFVPREDQLIFKFGQNDFNTSRNLAHLREYGTWQVIDSVLTDNPPKVERITKDELRNRNDLLSAVHKNKTKRDTEVIAANPGEFKAVVERILEIANNCQMNKLNMDFERELTKRLEFESRKAEAEAQARARTAEANAKARLADANASIRLLELQLEMKRLEMADKST